MARAPERRISSAGGRTAAAGRRLERTARLEALVVSADLARLVQDAARLLGLAELTRTADDTLSLLLDRRWLIVLTLQPDGLTVAGALPDRLAEDQARVLLRANFTPRTQGGGHFALDHDGRVWLLLRVDPTQGQARDIVNAIEACVDALETWQHRLVQGMARPPLPDPTQRV
ncbi:MAG: type III secretion system chaperone [Burkholderiales bacterium]|jgi:hypothetical protein|nr:type III secretion system chaperone [Burkholderiales bacterium]